MMGVSDEAAKASKRQRTSSGEMEPPTQITTMDSASAVVNFKVNFEQAKHLTAGDAVYSDAFYAGGYMWRIGFYPGCLDPTEVQDESEEDFSIGLELQSKSRRVKAIFEVLLINKNYRRPFSLVGLLVSRKLKKAYAQSRVTWSISSPDDNENHLIHKYVNDDGYVRFLCTIRVLADKPIHVPPSDIVKQCSNLLDSADGTDVAFTVDGETFHAHRAVLAARSPVFQAELLGSMDEAKMPHITLDDIAAPTFKIMLHFMYTDSLPGDDEFGQAPNDMLEHLLAAADRYALDRLKLLCAQKLWDKVSVDTVATTLACAERYSCLELKQRCIGFFAVEKNFKKAVLTEGFVKLVQLFPSIILELRDDVEE